MKGIGKLLGLFGLGALLIKAFTDDSKSDEDKPSKKRIFISFAKEDEKFRNFLSAQSRNERSPFEFADMSAKEPWDEETWRIECRKKIKKCNGMIVLLSKNTWHASGVRWEIKCAKEERVRVVGMHIRKNNKGAILPELSTSKVMTWSWDNLEKQINLMK